MSPSDPGSDADSGTKSAPEEEAWLDVFEHPEQRMIAEAAFVLTALAVPHQVTRHLEQTADSSGLLGQLNLGQGSLGPWRLSVPVSSAAFAGSQLEIYWSENANLSKRPPNSPAVDSGIIGCLGFLLVIWALPWLQEWTLTDWRGQGVMAARLVTEGEWWRSITALTLHADFGHIAGNSLFGVLFGSLLARQMGSGVSWLLILIAAASANTINAFSQGDAFRSLGASTATFAALGLLAAIVWRRGYFRKSGDWKRSFAPVFAGICLVAFTGIGDGNTDVAAHLFGFGCGIALGLACASIPFAWLNRRVQWLAGSTAIAVIVCAWWMVL